MLRERGDRADVAALKPCLLLLITEVIQVDLLHLISSHGIHADAEVDHQSRQRVAVDQNDLGINLGDIVMRLACEVRSGDEDAFSRPLALKSTCELLYVTFTFTIFPSNFPFPV